MSQLKKFNPYDLSEETLQAIATGRERVLENIVGTIVRNAEGGAVQHLQVVAPRGYGKSFLMRLVQSALKARVAEGLPVALALLPEEQHNVDAPHRLLNEIQRVLEGRPAESLLGGAFDDSDEAWEPAVAALDAAIAARLPGGRGIAVAVIENFDQLMAEVFRKPRDQSRLRALLARRGGRLMLLATATRRADDDYEQRLFHATGVIELLPWQEESCLDFFERLRGQRQTGPMPPQTRAKAQAIAQFIGGSPRMATALAQVLDSNDSLQAAQVLDALVDELTPYYKHRIESLSRRARTLLDALLRMGEPRTQSELAQRLGTTQARIAEPFNELRVRGEVAGLKARHSAEVLYRVNDRLMAHYYRKRHLTPGETASLLEGITELLADFFSLEEKRAEAERLRTLGRTADAVVMERLVAADLSPTDEGQALPSMRDPWRAELATSLIQLVQVGQFDEALTLCQQAKKRAEAAGNDKERMWTQQLLGWALANMKRYDEAVETIHHAIVLAERLNDLPARATSLSFLGWVHGQMGQDAAAVETLQQALPLIDQTDNLYEQARTRRLLSGFYGKMDRQSEAVELLRQALAVAEKSNSTSERLEASADLAEMLGQTNQYAEAIETTHTAITLAKSVGNVSKQAELTVLLGWGLLRTKLHAEAADTLRQAFALTEQAGDLYNQAQATRLLGVTLSELGLLSKSVDTLHQAIALAEQADNVAELRRSVLCLLDNAVATADDTTIITAWLRAINAVRASPKSNIEQHVAAWLADAAAAALRSRRFAEVWTTTATLEIEDEWVLSATQAELVETVAKLHQTQGRAAAYSLAAHLLDVLAQDAASRATRKDHPRATPEPIAFLRGTIAGLVEEVTDPALLRDIATLLEQRLPSETVTERTLLEAAARRAENPDDPAALERLDPDVATALDRMRGTEPEPDSKPSPRRGKRSSTPRRKK